jgi:hypothetical protein
MKSIIQQYQEAETNYREIMRRHPKSARAVVCWAKFRDLKAKILVHRTRESASAVIGHHASESVSP